MLDTSRSPWIALPRHSLLARTHVRSAAALGVLAVALSACSTAAEENRGAGASSERPVVVTTFSVLEDMVSHVGGDRIEVRSIVPRGAEIHEYDPTPSDIRGAAEADLVMENGLGLETWFEQFTAHSGADTVTLTDQIDPIPVTRLDDHPDAADTTESMPVNPHAWISPAAGQEYVAAIQDALSDLSPEDSEYFQDNADELIEELSDIDTQARERFSALEDGAHLVTCEGAFSYLTEEYELGEHYLWPLNAENEGTPAQAEAQIRYVEDHQVPTVFCESTVNDSAQRQVVEATGAELGPPLHVDSLTDESGPVPTYVDLLNHTLETIAEGLEAHAEESER